MVRRPVRNPERIAGPGECRRVAERRLPEVRRRVDQRPHTRPGGDFVEPRLRPAHELRRREPAVCLQIERGWEVAGGGLREAHEVVGLRDCVRGEEALRPIAVAIRFGDLVAAVGRLQTMLRMELRQMFFGQAVKTEQDMIGRFVSQMIANIACEGIDEFRPVIERRKKRQAIGATKLSRAFLCFNHSGFET